MSSGSVTIISIVYDHAYMHMQTLEVEQHAKSGNLEDTHEAMLIPIAVSMNDFVAHKIIQYIWHIVEPIYGSLVLRPYFFLLLSLFIHKS